MRQQLQDEKEKNTRLEECLVKQESIAQEADHSLAQTRQQLQDEKERNTRLEECLVEREREITSFSRAFALQPQAFDEEMFTLQDDFIVSDDDEVNEEIADDSDQADITSEVNGILGNLPDGDEKFDFGLHASSSHDDQHGDSNRHLNNNNNSNENGNNSLDSMRNENEDETNTSFEQPNEDMTSVETEGFGDSEDRSEDRSGVEQGIQTPQVKDAPRKFLSYKDRLLS